jgi:Zn-dependent peptidase ImmA (M78 family)/transcriptional regulator with XRE-family HTH domain
VEPRAFDARRLTLARWAAELTKRELASRVGISPASVTQYEAGNTTPRAQTVAQAALALGVPVDYFYSAPGRRRPLVEGRSFFRSLRATRQRERDQADARAEHVYDLVHYLERVVRLPDVQIPDVVLAAAGPSRIQIEDLAAEVRERWALPVGPVSNMTRLLEAHGVVVARLRTTTHRLDAFSRWFETRPVVLLWDAKEDKGRSRFDAAHELAHLVMHHEPEPGDRHQEHEAHAFAAALLMPAEAVVVDLPRRVSRPADWEVLFAARRRWGVSAAALLYRARELAVLSDASFRRAMARLSEMGLRHHDGQELGSPEEPVMLHDAVLRVLEHREMTLDDLARVLCFSRRQLDDVLGGAPAIPAVPAHVDTPQPANHAGPDRLQAI